MQRGIEGNSLFCFVIFFLQPLFFCYIDIVLQSARLCTVPPKQKNIKRKIHICYVFMNKTMFFFFFKKNLRMTFKNHVCSGLSDGPSTHWPV